METITGNIFRDTPPGTPTNTPDGNLSINIASIGTTGFVVTNIPRSLSGSRTVVLLGPAAVMQAIVDNRFSLLKLTGVSLGKRVPAGAGPHANPDGIEHFQVSSVVLADTGQKAAVVPFRRGGVTSTDTERTTAPRVTPPTTTAPTKTAPEVTAPEVIPLAVVEPPGPFRDPVLRQEANRVGCIGCGPAFQDKSGVSTTRASFALTEAPPPPEVEVVTAGITGQPFSPFMSQIVLGLPLWIWLVGGAVLLSTREKG